MLLENRNIATMQHLNGFVEDKTWKVWKFAMLNRGVLDSAGAGIKNKVVNKLFKKSWGAHRGELQFAPKNFNALWKER